MHFTHYSVRYLAKCGIDNSGFVGHYDIRKETRIPLTNHMSRLLLLTIALAIALCSPAWAQQERSIVSIDAGSRVQEIADLGIDIWSVSAGYVTAAVAPDELQQIHDLGFQWKVLFASVAQFERSVAVAAVPQAVDYRNHDQVVAEMQRIATEYPTIAKLYNLGTTYENRTIWALKISEKANLDRTVPRVLYCGEHHAREWISVEVPLRLADYIVSSYATDQTMQLRLNQAEIWVVPMVNPDGYAYSWGSGHRNWRKNRKPVGSGCYGVDDNRNYGYHWGQSGSSGSPCNETYRGTSAFSEKETQAIRDLMLARQFYSLLSFHNYEQLVMWPWGYTTSAPPDAAI